MEASCSRHEQRKEKTVRTSCKPEINFIDQIPICANCCDASGNQRHVFRDPVVVPSVREHVPAYFCLRLSCLSRRLTMGLLRRAPVLPVWLYFTQSHCRVRSWTQGARMVRIQRSGRTGSPGCEPLQNETPHAGGPKETHELGFLTSFPFPQGPAVLRGSERTCEDPSLSLGECCASHRHTSCHGTPITSRRYANAASIM